MTDLINIGLGDETDPEEIAQEGVDYIKSYFPSWEPAEGDLLYRQIMATALQTSTQRYLAARTADDIFRYFGTLAGLPAQEPTPATGDTTWTMTDTAGYTIEAGTVLVGTGVDGQPAAFQVTSEVTILPGNNATAAGEVPIEALEEGTNSNGLTGSLSLENPLSYVESVVLDSATSGGDDGETNSAYLDRLTSLLRLQAPRPILPEDFAIMAETLVTGVGRATAIDLYNADTMATNEPRCCTVVAVDDDGEALDPAIKNDIDELLQSEREVNFLVFVEDPTYATVDAWVTYEIYDTYDSSTVDAAVTAAIEDYLDPSNWGIPPTDSGTARSWDNTDTVRLNEIISLVDQVDGVKYVDQVWLAEEGDPGVESDLSLTGIAPLTRAGTITLVAP